MENSVRQHARISLVVWIFVVIAVSFFFFGFGGPEDFDNDSFRVLALSLSYGAGILVQVALMLRLRFGRRRGAVARDEMDDDIERQSSSAALIITLIFGYGLSIGLWEGYRSAEAAPVGWFMLMACSLVAVGVIASATSTLVLHRRYESDGS